MRPKVLLITVLSAALVLLTCMGFALPVDFAVAMGLGWAWYVARTYPEVQVAPAGVATATVCLILFVVGSQLFLNWLYRAVQHRAGRKSDLHGNERWKWRWTASLTTVIVLMFVAGMSVVGMTHQLGWLFNSKEPWVESGSGPKSALARAVSTNNLKQIGMALHWYHQAYESLPPGGTFDREGHPLQSWQTMILPYLEMGDLYDQIDVSAPWNDSRNAAAFQTEIPQYLRYGIPETRNADGYALSHFAGSVHMLGGDHPHTFGEVSDGTANTLMAGEITHGFKAWGDPTNWRDPTLGLNSNPRGFASPSPGGVNFLMVDGSVHFIKNSVDPKVLKALSTPAGGEKAMLPTSTDKCEEQTIACSRTLHRRPLARLDAGRGPLPAGRGLHGRRHAAEIVHCPGASGLVPAGGGWPRQPDPDELLRLRQPVHARHDQALPRPIRRHRDRRPAGR